jgi:hypothetical protein
MLINKDTKPWAAVAIVLFLIATALYIPYHFYSQPEGPSGGTWPGIIYGVVGTGMILFAMALTPRKKLRTLRVGRAYWWVQGHIWFGLLAFPVIIYHAGLRPGLWGGYLPWALMIVFLLIELSGIFGLIMQNILPSKILRDVAYETIFEQIEAVVGKLRDEADAKFTAAVGRREEMAFDMDNVPTGAVAVVTAEETKSTTALVESFYRQSVVPFLATKYDKSLPLASVGQSNAAFDQLRLRTPLALHDAINDLQSIVDERRQLQRQRMLHYWLHGWLWVHVPLSAALLILTIVHIFVALAYRRPW